MLSCKCTDAHRIQACLDRQTDRQADRQTVIVCSVMSGLAMTFCSSRGMLALALNSTSPNARGTATVRNGLYASTCVNIHTFMTMHFLRFLRQQIHDTIMSVQTHTDIYTCNCIHTHMHQRRETQLCLIHTSYIHTYIHHTHILVCLM
jgi:hypothetical protein